MYIPEDITGAPVRVYTENGGHEPAELQEPLRFHGCRVKYPDGRSQFLAYADLADPSEQQTWAWSADPRRLAAEQVRKAAGADVFEVVPDKSGTWLRWEVRAYKRQGFDLTDLGVHYV